MSVVQPTDPQTAELQAADDTTQRVSSKNPTTWPKNPKRMAAGKAISAKTKQAREAPKKALDEASAIIAKQEAEPSPEPAQSETKNILTTTQWLNVISIGVSLAGIYYKRKEFQNFLTPPPAPPPTSPVDVAPAKQAYAEWIKLYIQRRLTSCKFSSELLPFLE